MTYLQIFLVAWGICGVIVFQSFTRHMAVQASLDDSPPPLLADAPIFGISVAIGMGLAGGITALCWVTSWILSF